MIVRCTLLVLLSVAIAACSNPLPFGPGRVEIKLDQAAVLAVEHSTLFPDSSRDPAAPARREVLRLVISSKTELLSYFKERDRQVQVRCAVDGNRSGKSYSGFALGPVPERRLHLNSTNAALQPPYRYTIYAFIDLKAEDVQYKGGKPAGSLDLKKEAFGTLKCHLLGVTKAPVLLPRSNDIIVSATTFQSLLHAANLR
jgi:hypothetical protein